MVQLLLEIEEIQKHYRTKRTPYPEIMLPDLNVENLDEMKNIIDGLMVRYPAKFTWHDITEISEETERRKLWLYRECIFAQILIYIIVASQLTAPLPVSLPADFDLSAHSLNMFGSNNATSDIDVSVDGPHASYFIELVEKVWKELTHEDTTKLDVEFYGDFLELFDEKGAETFINSREFSKARLQILPYVGASILRNTKTLDFPMLNEFLDKYASIIPELKDPSWKERATDLMSEWSKQGPDQQRETYYRLLREAEAVRKEPGSANPYEQHLRAFLLLSKANLYRSENYVLPSTVIFVVRDIQAMSPNPVPSMCSAYHVKLASCALGAFTYLTAAMEQIGFMQRFAGMESKQKKYGARLERAMNKVEMNGGRRRVRRAARKTKKRRVSRKRATRGRRYSKK